ncbi:hypothetical protein PAXRUDRAFT_36333 [Paxillus rubicundulus Ve08.2h10]|uniref:Phospholipase D/nuclease n=1 Tax=Paxillus rubicundulus Ve08.2h10 TaxID=930991 RepID=A0A0D0CWK5_9AGAM|nr:hypothetical protein PAXRUDRAFT_36333 [Paxillus rubicundulus Ve08.2h10]
MDRDDDLERAIALSLQDTQASNSHMSQDEVVPVDVPDKEEERFQAELQRAIEASKAGMDAHHCTAQVPKPTHTPESQASQRSTSTPSGSVPFLSERAQLEKERLERLKRLRSQNEDNEAGLEKTQPPPVKRQHLSSAHERTDRRINHNVMTPVMGQPFWDGELRPTANRHSQPREDGRATFRLTEILGPKNDISFAIISSYSTSMSWIYEFFDPHTPVILVSQPDQSGRATIKNVLPNWIMTVPFLRNGRGCQHMKIFYKTGRLRVVISTANLIDYDWRDIENAVWLQDVPPRSQPLSHDLIDVDDFPSIMQKVLHAVNVRPALANMLANDHPSLPLQSIHDLRSKWDFSKVRVKLIPSIAGRHEGWPAVIQTGHTRLMKAMRDLGLRTGKGRAAKELSIECQGSSIGTYSTQWLNEFHFSARGESADEWLDEPKNRRSKLPWPTVKIVFPSLKTVKASALGESGGGTMFCRTNQWEAAKFPRELFHDSNSAGGRVLMHTKMIIATFRQKSTPFSGSSKSVPDARSAAQSSSDQGKSKVIVISDSETESEIEPQEDAVGAQNGAIGWAYVGSHNFTPSAWGTLSGSGLNPVLNLVNYELGILFPLYGEEDVKRVACFKRPPRKYTLGEDRAWVRNSLLSPFGLF